MAATKFPIDTDKPTLEVTLPVGTHTLQLVVEDSAGKISVPDSVVVTVVRVIPPRADAGSDLRVETDGDEMVVRLDAGKSEAFLGQRVVRYHWELKTNPDRG